MKNRLQRVTSLVLLLCAPLSFGDVIFSRRVYKENGVSYQQIWSWKPTDGTLKALTESPRDHYEPRCDGRVIKFTSPSPDVTEDVRLWGLHPATGEERAIGPAPEEKAEPVSGSPGCARFAKRGDLQACANDETLVLSRSGKQIGRYQIQVNTCPIDNHGSLGRCETPIRSLAWTEDRKWLLIGEQGLHDGSGQRQDDYYLLDLATMKISMMASAETAFWLPGRDQIVYVTPQGLAALRGGRSKRYVWAQQLMLFDPLKGASAAVTSGLTNNIDPSWCESSK